MKSKKGLSLLFWFIVIVIIIIFGASLSVYLMGLFGQAYQTGVKYVEQAGVTAKILPASWYNIKITDAVMGEIKFTVQDKNTSFYVTDFDPTVGYKIYENSSQTTVLNVKEYPVAYIAVVVDNTTTSKFDDNFWNNLTKIKFSEANVAIIPVNSPIPEIIDFSKSNELVKPIISATGSADYWGALAKAGDSLPVVQARRDLGLNFLAIILVSEGRNDIISDKDTEKIASALLPPPTSHFYMLRSDCNIPATGGGSNVQKNISNGTLEGYRAAPSVSRADCYTNASALFDDLLVKDLAPITLEYEPKNLAVYAGDMKLRNITVEVTKRTGVLGTEGAYSGKGSTPRGLMPRY